MLMSKPELDERNRLLDEVFHGRMTPDDAEQEASRLNLRPFSCEPDANLFNPLDLPTWSLAMTVAWIAWRNLDHVRLSWPEYCKECWEWRWHHSRVPVPAENSWKEVEGWELKQRQPHSLHFQGLMEAVDDLWPDDDLKVLSVKSAREQLWKSLINEDIKAIAVNHLSGSAPLVIPFHEFDKLEPISDRNGNDELRFSTDVLQRGYFSVSFRLTDILRIWPSLDQVSTSRIGAPYRYDWLTFQDYAISVLEQEGDFNPALDTKWNQAALEKRMAEWCSKNWGKEPSEMSIRTQVKASVKRFREIRQG